MQIQSCPYTQYADELVTILSHGGAFLTVKSQERPNTMTIGWGNLGFAWGKPILTVMVRRSRFTYSLIERAGEFTVTFPREDVSDALRFCGSKSGRDVDKIQMCQLPLLDGRSIATPIIGVRGLQYECRTVFRSPIQPDVLDSSIDARYYGDLDYHVLYFGEILDCYQTL